MFFRLIKKSLIAGELINVPDKIPVIDGLLAATALIQDLILVNPYVRDV